MDRHGTKIEDDVLFVETDDDWLEIGALPDIYALVGGHEYTIEYDPEAAAVAWLDTAPDNTLTFDVKNVLADMSYATETVDVLANTPLDPGEADYPERTSLFADLMVEIWDSKGNLDNSR